MAIIASTYVIITITIVIVTLLRPAYIVIGLFFSLLIAINTNLLLLIYKLLAI